jgi:DNA-binding IclR family transcriptional regulator
MGRPDPLEATASRESQVPGDAIHKHRIPVIDRMMDVLGQLEGRDDSATIRDLVLALELPRTSVYRILNSLELHDMVQRDAGGGYRLGRRLVGLAARAAANAGEADLVARAQPYLDKLAASLGEGCKLSVLDRDDVLVLAAARGRRQYALSVIPGQRMAPHAGAASKLLLAHLPEADLERYLGKPLEAFTPRTFTDPKRLRSELARVKRLGWAQDKGESAISIHAFAAPVFDKRGHMGAAISVPFLAGTEPERMAEIRHAVVAAAKSLSNEMPEFG